MSVLAKVVALVSTKGAIGIAVAALAVGAATAATEASVTGSTDPQNWGQQVVAQVNACKAALTPDSHGIGQCVSTFAKQHGPKVSADHRASGARGSSARTNHPTSTDHPGNGNNQGQPNNPSQSTNHPGQPTGHPVGPPTSHS